jgi:hypothetical protein
MGKRGRDEDDGAAVEQLVVKPDTVCEAILRETRTWRDKCNSLYDIESKMYISKDQIVLKVGFFDEISCSQVLSLSSLKLPGNYSIRSFECDLKKQLVVFTVTRGAKAARVAVRRRSGRLLHLFHRQAHAGRQRLERPDRVIRLAMIERDRNRLVQTRPCDLLLADC